MAKKNFSGGLESLLGGGTSKTEKKIPESKKASAPEFIEEEKTFEQLLETEKPLIQQDEKVGSIIFEMPTLSSGNEIQYTDNQALLEIKKETIEVPQNINSSSVESYFEAVLGNHRVEKLKKIAERDKLSFEEVAKEAIDFYLDFQVELF
jgi:hypothetical protein